MNEFTIKKERKNAKNVTKIFKMFCFDFFPKFIDADMLHKTTGGAIISIITIATVASLSFFEIYSFVHPPIKEELVSLSELHGALSDFSIAFNITVNIPCVLLHLDLFDVLGTLNDPNSKSVYKLRLDQNSEPIPFSQVSQSCGSCYGAESMEKPCCNTCEDIVNAYSRRGLSLANISKWQQCINEKIDFSGKEKCQIFGTNHVSAIDGGFHVAPGINTYGDSHEFSAIKDTINLTHYIDHITFGNSFGPQPLDGIFALQEEKGEFHYRYDLKVVPTVMRDAEGKVTHGFQYAVDNAKIPVSEKGRLGAGIYFTYNFAPVAVVGTPDRFTIYVLAARLFCIFGGGYFLAKLIDSFSYRLNTMEGKMKIGKGA